MSQVEVAEKTYLMPPQEGISVTHFLTVADIQRSVDFYAKVFGGPVLSRGDAKGAPGYVRIANTWLIVNVGGGPTPDKPKTILRVPPDSDQVSSFMNIRVADIQACYKLWKKAAAAPSSLRSPRTNTAKRAVTSATPTATSSRLGRANPSSPTARRRRRFVSAGLGLEGHGNDHGSSADHVERDG